MVVVKHHIVFYEIPVSEWDTRIEITLDGLNYGGVQGVVIAVKIVQNLWILGDNQKQHLVAHASSPNGERGNLIEFLGFLVDSLSHPSHI